GISLAGDVNGNIIVTGAFQDTLDFNPGPATNNLIAPGGYQNLFVAKYDSSGNYIWAFSITDSTSTTSGASVTTDSQGNILLTGSFGATADFNPGSAIHDLTVKGVSDIFVAKYDENGNYLWVFDIGTPGGWSQATGLSINTDNKDNILVTGYFGGNADFAPGPSTNLLSAGTQSMFIAKYNTNGINSWAKCITNANAGYGITTDADANVLVTGDFSGTANFNPVASANLVANGYQDIFIAKYDSSGNFGWAFNAGCDSTYNVGAAISCDAIGNIWITGQTTGNVDFDPSSATNYVNTPPYQNSYIAKYNSQLMGIQQVSNNNYINVFPNPTSGYIVIDANKEEPGNLVIYNLLGEKVFESSEKSNYFKINLQASGVYQIVFTSGQLISTKKIIVEH
ncbi:MAG TPA: T9SS type A sorting domain-containing protein, partial [Bacteroidia bacterium]|nr:T9SS type A sorting domain-containing protein [Bacteroidia bacterium]